MINKLMTVGRLVADPTMTSRQDGSQICKFRVASNNKHRNDDNTFGTNWYNCSAWGKTGENIAKFFHKGDKIVLEGDLTIRDYTDKNGQLRTSIDVDVRDFEFASSSGGNQQGQAQAPVVQTAPAVQYQAAPAQAAYAPPPASAAYVPQTQVAYAPPAPIQSTPLGDDDVPF
jgi:single-strand DNA-binding protein